MTSSREILAELVTLNPARVTAEGMQQIAALAAMKHPTDAAKQAALDTANDNLALLVKRIETLGSALIAARAEEKATTKQARADEARAEFEAAVKLVRIARPALGKKIAKLFDELRTLLSEYSDATDRANAHARNVVRLCAVDQAAYLNKYVILQGDLKGNSGSVNPAVVSALSKIIGEARAGMGFGDAVSVNAAGSDVPLDAAIAVDGDRVTAEMKRLVETAEDRDAQPEDDQAAA